MTTLQANRDRSLIETATQYVELYLRDDKFFREVLERGFKRHFARQSFDEGQARSYIQEFIKNHLEEELDRFRTDQHARTATIALLEAGFEVVDLYALAQVFVDSFHNKGFVF